MTLPDLRAWVWLAAIAGTLTGCARRPAVFPPMAPRDSLEVLARRAEAVRTLWAECDVTLTDPAGESVRLDGAMAASFPDRLRIRAWKFGHAVFDLTLVDGRTWLLTANEPAAEPRPGMLSGARLDRLSRAIGLMGADFFRAASPTADPVTGERLTVSGPGFDGSVARCLIDRPTLTVRRFDFSDPGSPGPPATVTLDRYRVIDGIPWPTILGFTSSEGRITVRLRGVRLNEPVSESAFTPPRRAVEQP